MRLYKILRYGEFIIIFLYNYSRYLHHRYNNYRYVYRALLYICAYIMTAIIVYNVKQIYNLKFFGECMYINIILLECVQDTHCHCTYLCCVQQRGCGVELEVDFIPFVGSGLVCKEQLHLAAEDSRLHAGLQLSIKWKHLCK